MSSVQPCLSTVVLRPAPPCGARKICWLQIQYRNHYFANGGINIYIISDLLFTNKIKRFIKHKNSYNTRMDVLFGFLLILPLLLFCPLSPPLPLLSHKFVENESCNRGSLISQTNTLTTIAQELANRVVYYLTC